MARTKAVLGAGARLSDYLSASLLARVVLADEGARHIAQRQRGVRSQYCSFRYISATMRSLSLRSKSWHEPRRCWVRVLG